MIVRGQTEPTVGTLRLFVRVHLFDLRGPGRLLDWRLGSAARFVGGRRAHCHHARSSRLPPEDWIALDYHTGSPLPRGPGLVGIRALASNRRTGRDLKGKGPAPRLVVPSATMRKLGDVGRLTRQDKGPNPGQGLQGAPCEQFQTHPPVVPDCESHRDAML